MTHEPFSSFEFDGVLGLGLPGLSQNAEFNFFNVATSTGAVRTNSSHLFTVFLATSDLEQSDITFGGMRVEHIADGSPQELGWCNVVQPELGYWALHDSRHPGSRTAPYPQHGWNGLAEPSTQAQGAQHHTIQAPAESHRRCALPSYHQR